MGGLSVTVLGCDGSYPGPGGAGSGYLVQSGDTNVWVDAGPGTLAELQRHIDIEQIDAIVITHEHVDHWSDLEHLAVAAHYIVERPPLPLYCEADLPAMMRVGPAVGAFARQAIGPDSEIAVGPMRITFSRTDHSVPTLAVRVDGDGRSLGYSADSGPGWGLGELGPGLDLALCEATYLSDKEGMVPHMSARQAGQAARQAAVARLLLTHKWARVDSQAILAEALTEFDGPVELAVAGRRYQA